MMISENKINQPQTFAEKQIFVCESPPETFALGERFGENLRGGTVVLLSGNLGAGKTLFTKGVLYALDYDAREVTSPSFTLVNHYRAKLDVYHIDLWRINENSDAAFAVGLDEIVEDENAVVIIEWSERLRSFAFPANIFRVVIEGDGDDARRIVIENLTAK